MNYKEKTTVLATVILLVFLALAGSWTPSHAAVFSSPQAECEADVSAGGLGGTWIGIAPGNHGVNCIGAQKGAVTTCGGPSYLVNWAYYGAGGYFPVPSTCTMINYGMRRSGVCKLVSIDDAYLGGNLTAIIKGAPSVLKLKADGKTYSLPVVPGSVVANGDGTYTAQFYTIDPVTGQALVPAGEYTARCHGANGSKDGGSSNSVVIGY